MWINDLKLVGKVQKKLSLPRSYLVKASNGGVYRRNRWHLVERGAKYERLASERKVNGRKYKTNFELRTSLRE